MIFYEFGYLICGQALAIKFTFIKSTGYFWRHSHVLNPGIDSRIYHFKFRSIGASFQNRRQGVVDGGISIEFDFPSPSNILFNQLNGDFSDIYSIGLISASLGRPKKSLENVHSTLPVLISATANAVSGIVRCYSLNHKIYEIFTFVFPYCSWLVFKESSDNLCCDLIWMLLLILCKHSIILSTRASNNAFIRFASEP